MIRQAVPYLITVAAGVALWRAYSRARPRRVPDAYGAVWEARKDRYYATHPRLCHACGSDRDVELHHIELARSRRPMGDEPDWALIPLCQPHHTGRPSRRHPLRLGVHWWHRRLRWLRLWRRWDTSYATGLVVWWGRLRWGLFRHVPARTFEDAA